ncbi:vWA domain-containing protein [Parvularcula marina]|uniref:VWA domain-containing protein n=1 Tax=Parvularcula marina TaxID=2292771 RepID=A0A371RIR5_9PROT|nr:VWA domain-containing protein [Parvularcula marina]RFB05332.1 VWA domain-containing protein [Parvularcula marina]
MKYRLLITCAMAAGLVACASHDKDNSKSNRSDATADETFAEYAPPPQMMREMAAGAQLDLAYAPMPAPYAQPADTSRYSNGVQNPVFRVSENPVSTFSADVDTASYSIARRYLTDGQLPPSEAVRIEEFVNAFDYNYPLPKSSNEPFRPDIEIVPTPWNDKSELIRIGIKGYDIEPDEIPDSNIVLLLDVSGSMNSPDKLPLLVSSMKLLVDELDKDDTVSIVVYAGAAGVVLDPTPGNEKVKIKQALDRLSAGGSTAGGQGLQLAYDLAMENFDKDGVNRIILATDGDFNVGVTGDDPLTDFVARKRKEGVYLSVLGFGAGNLNDQMMQSIAQNGNGVAAYIDTLDEARRVLVREFTSSMFPIAQDLKFQVEFNPAAVSEYRLIGYQTRILNEEDFKNDAVDAGDIGSGHTVTALYEIVRTGEEGWLEDRRYASTSSVDYDPDAELGFLRIRYKRPGQMKSRLIEQAITPDDRVRSFAAASDDTRFAILAAGFGEKLSRSSYAESLTYDWLIDEANDAKGRDEYGDRAGFVQLLRRAGELSPEDRG